MQVCSCCSFQGVAIIGIAGDGAGADDVGVFVGDGQAGLDAKLVGLRALSLPMHSTFCACRAYDLSLPLGCCGRMRSAQAR